MRITLIGLMFLPAAFFCSCGREPERAAPAEPPPQQARVADGFSPQVVQGVIDWGGPMPGSFQAVRHIYKEGWNECGGTEKITWYATEDGLILCPLADHIDAFAPIGVLAGAVLTGSLPGHAQPVVDHYELWLWVDVNNNRQADPDDLINGQLQSWRRIARDTPYAVNRMINIIPEESGFQTPREGLYAGETYLLLIRVVAGELDSFQFTGPVTVDTDSGSVRAEWGRRVVNNWTPSGPGAYGGADGSGWPGIDDYEILSFRINNPPAKPIP